VLTKDEEAEDMADVMDAKTVAAYQAHYEAHRRLMEPAAKPEPEGKREPRVGDVWRGVSGEQLLLLQPSGNRPRIYRCRVVVSTIRAYPLGYEDSWTIEGPYWTLLTPATSQPRTPKAGDVLQAPYGARYRVRDVGTARCELEKVAHGPPGSGDDVAILGTVVIMACVPSWPIAPDPLCQHSEPREATDAVLCRDCGAAALGCRCATLGGKTAREWAAHRALEKAKPGDVIAEAVVDGVRYQRVMPQPTCPCCREVRLHKAADVLRCRVCSWTGSPADLVKAMEPVKQPPRFKVGQWVRVGKLAAMVMESAFLGGEWCYSLTAEDKCKDALYSRHPSPPDIRERELTEAPDAR
jgi:hypothetical protein